MRITRTRILIADDNAAVRKAIRALLESRPELEVAAEATNGRQAVERTLQILPHVVLLDIAMPELDGFSAARQIRSQAPEVQLLMLSYYDSPPIIEKALTVGVLGFVVKNDLADDLLPAIEAVANRQAFLSRSAARSIGNLRMDTNGGKFA